MANMKAIITRAFSDPSKYELATVARPVISQPSDVVMRVHAASLNPIDVKLATGIFKFAVKYDFPFKIGYDLAGVVTEVGSGVKRFKVGDEVYTRLPEAERGSWSEYAKCDEKYIAHKPKSLNFGDAASLPLVTVTALQALRRYKGSLEGKTVFVPAGLGGSGSAALQLAKNVFKAGKVITTVSTAKVAKVPQYLGEGVVDQIIDYTKEKPTDVIPRHSVDFILDTTGQAMDFLSLMTPKTGVIVSISTTPSAQTLAESSFLQVPGDPHVPLVPRLFLDALDGIRQLRAWRWGVSYSYMILVSNAEDLEQVTTWVEDGTLRPVVGSRTDMWDVEAVKAECQLAFNGKGGFGKAIFEAIKD